jgi:hypothetical protein
VPKQVGPDPTEVCGRAAVGVDRRLAGGSRWVKLFAQANGFRPMVAVTMVAVTMADGLVVYHPRGGRDELLGSTEKRSGSSGVPAPVRVSLPSLPCGLEQPADNGGSQGRDGLSLSFAALAIPGRQLAVDVVQGGCAISESGDQLAVVGDFP